MPKANSERPVLVTTHSPRGLLWICPRNIWRDDSIACRTIVRLLELRSSRLHGTRIARTGIAVQNRPSGRY